jgi:hypothetical protein
MTEIPLPRAPKVERVSDVPVPPVSGPERATKARDEFRDRPPASPAAKSRPVYGRGEASFHLLLPAVSLLIGLTLLIGLLRYVNHGASAEDEPLLNFLIGGTLTVLGGVELRLWQRRLGRPFTPPGE